MRATGRVVVIVVGAIVAVVMVTASRAVIEYDRFSRRGYAAVIRKTIPWRASPWIAPLLPLVTLAPWSPEAIGIAVAAVLAEIYSVCLHREAWIAAFEPQYLPRAGRPLWGSPPCPDDRRLHYLVRVQVLYAVALAVSGLLLPLDTVACLGWVLFAAKFFGHASTDFEVFYHWNLHVGVLQVMGKPRLTRAVELVVELFLGPLNGYIPHVYRTDHILIHHPENSGPDDIHSPLPYRRTSFLEFGVFALHTMTSLLLGRGVVNHRRCRRSARRLVVIGIAGFWLCAVLLTVMNCLLGLWLVFAVVLHSINATRSQYIWHGLSDHARARDPMAGTLLWVYGHEYWSALLAAEATATGTDEAPHPDTDWAFFDNHHLLHHLHPRAHYQEYPALLARRAPDMAAMGATVLDLRGMDTFAFDCWSSRLDRLEAVLIAPNVKEPRGFLANRLAAAPAYRSPYGPLCEGRAGRTVDRILTAVVGLLTCRRG